MRGRLALGRWPSPYNPDPKDLGFPVHHGIVWLGAFLSLVFPLFAIFALYVAKEYGTLRKDLRIAIAIFRAVTGLAVTIVVLDPGQFGQWFAD